MHKLATVLSALVVLVTGGTSAASAQDPEWPWRYDHWPQQQPWQQDDAPSALRFGGGGEAPQPVDPQNWKNPDNMTWLDYRKPPGTNWADPNVSGSVRTFRGALVLLDYPNQPFVVTQPQGSTVFANPSAEASGIPREQVAQFYRDFLNTPNQLNRGHTLHEYWMEDSGGRYGVELTAFGPYTVPGKDHEYASEFEHVDEANRLHFYVLDVHRSREGVLSYTVAVRSLDGSGPQRRGARLLPTAGIPTGDGWARCRFLLRNSGKAAVAGQHPEDVSRYLGSDVYRLSAEARTNGWSVWLPNELASAEFGRIEGATVYAKRESGSHIGRITLTATSESDPSKSDTATCLALAR